MSRIGSLATRVRRDGAFHLLPLLVVATAINTSVLAGVITLRAAGRDLTEAPVHLLILTLWLPIAIYLMLGQVRTRCHRLELALPIPARALWLSHTVAVALSGAVVLAASFGVLALNQMLLSGLRGGAGVDLGLPSLVAPMTAALLLATALVQRLDPGLWKLGGGARYWVTLVASLVALLALLLGLGRQPWVAAAVCLLLAGWLAAGAYRSLPEALELVPRQPRPRRRSTRAPAQPTAAASAQPGAGGVLRLVFAVVHNAPPWKRFAPWVLYSFVVLVGFFLSGVLDRYGDFDEARFLNLPMGSYILLAAAGLLTYHLHRLDPLPVPRRLVFGMLTLPCLAFFCLGWGAGRVLLATEGQSRPLVSYQVAGRHHWVEVDPGYMGSASGEAPVLTSPWGESHRAWHRPLFRGGSAILYSPFATSEESSARFEALMASRAIEAVYGAVIPHQEILERYFLVEEGRVAGLREGGLALLEDYPGLGAPPRPGAETPVYLALVVVPWLLAMALFVSTFRATSSLKLIRAVYWAVLIALLALMVGQLVLTMAGWYNVAAAHGLFEITLRQLGGSPLATLVAWIGSLSLIVLCYLLGERQFVRAELPQAPIQCSWIDFGKDDG